MKLFSFFSILGALILSCDASHYLLEKRATRVSIISYALTNNVLSGSIMVVWSLSMSSLIYIAQLIPTP